MFEYYVLRDARNVIFTTDTERHLARKSFSRYKANEFISGYGADPPVDINKCNSSLFFNQFPHLTDKRLLLFVGRIHEKKGLDLLFKAFASLNFKDNVHIVIVAPIDTSSKYYKYLISLINKLSLRSCHLDLACTGSLRVVCL